MDDKDLLENFGFNLKIERLKRKISQEKLAEALNFSTVYISNVESGKHNISLINALKFCNYFDLSVENLLKEK
jgi:transcriptional regulator with XRE-family HTH domain